MRIVLVTLLALAVVAAPAAQAAACRCEAEAAVREAAAATCCCGDATACNCCGHHAPATPARTMAGCACAQDAPLSSETVDVELPAPVLLTTLPPVHETAAAVAFAVRLAPSAPRDPHPEVRAPLLL